MKFKKIISVVLAAAIASSAFSVTASAETQQITETVDKYQASGDSFVEGDFKYTELDDGTLLVRCNNKDITKAVIPSSVNGKKVTGIGDYAFYGCENLQSVTIPNSVTSIGEDAFVYCQNLQSVTIPNSVTSIGDYAFYGCENLQSVTIPNSVTSIGDYAFNDCENLQSVTIPDSVKNIGDSAFGGCTSLQSVTISESVNEIGDYAFCDCTSLVAINVNSNNKYFSSTDGVLFNKDKTEIIKYPAGKKDKPYSIPNSVTSIGNFAFEDCANLQSVTIPNSVKSMGYYAFSNCANLQSVTIENGVPCIDYCAFFRCTSLQSVTIPDSVTRMVEAAFNNCTNLKDVYYTGTKEQWNAITIENGNECLLNATIHYNYKPPITNLKATATSNSAKLTWDKNTSASYYKVFVYQDNKWNQLAEVTTNSYTATGLAVNTSYKFRVSAYNSGNKLLAYSDVTVKTPAGKLANLKGSTSSTNTAKLTWDKNTSAAYYKVFVYQNNKWNQLAKISTNSYTATGLAANTSYKFRVSAYSSGNKLLAYSDTTVKTLANIANLKGSTSSTNTAKLTWSKPTSASYYKVFVYQNNKWNQLAKISTNSYTATGLAANTTYKFRVSAYNSGNKLLAYSDTTVKTLANVANLKATTTSNSAKLTWSKPTSASYYKVFVYQNNKWNQLAKISTNSYTATGLAANTSYKYRVSAYNSGNKLIAYSDVTVKTK